jgi:thiol-disulfide isomerase/thioredoxin
MVFDSVMKSISNFCNDDDTCIFVVLVLIGFLLCMFFNRDRDEGYADYPFGEPGKPMGNDKKEVEEKHDYGGIGREPTKHAEIEDSIEPPPAPKMPQIAEAEKLPGLHPQNPGDPVNGLGTVSKSVEMARAGKQYNSEILPNTGGIDVKGFSLDSGPVGVPLSYSMYFPYAKFKDGPPSDLGPQFPTGPGKDGSSDEGEPGVPSVQPKDTIVDPTVSQDSAVPTSNKEMKLVLFYAPWCGHSKNMLGDYEAVTQKYNNKEINGVTLSIIKVDMEANKEGAKPYNVDIRGFPTLYTFVEENGKLVSQPFSPRDEAGIVAELQKRTKSLGSQ